MGGQPIPYLTSIAWLQEGILWRTDVCAQVRNSTQLNSTPLHSKQFGGYKGESESESCLWTLLGDLSRKKKYPCFVFYSFFSYVSIWWLPYTCGDMTLIAKNARQSRNGQVPL